MIARPPPVQSPAPGRVWLRAGALEGVAFGKLMKINHPAPGDVIRNPAHAAGYGTAFQGTAEGPTQGGSNGVIGEFKASLESRRGPDQRIGAFEESASGSGEELHLYGDPIVFG